MTDAFLEGRRGYLDVVNDDAADPAERSLARAAYVTLLPERTISRCPITGELVQVPFDGVGLDGPFWNSMDPARRAPAEGLPGSVVSWTGGLRLAEPVETAPFMALAGPAVPFVVGALLEVDEVVAVIGPAGVGAHDGFSVVYFAEDAPAVDERLLLNEWGARSYRYVYASGVERSGTSQLYDDDADFEIARWIDEGKLRWIAPSDDSWTVRDGRDGCPYLGWDGVRAMQRTIDGTIKRF